MLFCVNAAVAAFTGTVEEKNNSKFTLKNLTKISKNYSLSALRNGVFRYNGTLDLNQQKVGNSVEINSMMRLEKGNTTYVYPYKYKVKMPRFKTPTAPGF